MIASVISVSTTPVQVIPKGEGTVTYRMAFLVQTNGTVFFGGPNVDMVNNGFPISSGTIVALDVANDDLWAVAAAPQTVTILRRGNA